VFVHVLRASDKIICAFILADKKVSHIYKGEAEEVTGRMKNNIWGMVCAEIFTGDRSGEGKLISQHFLCGQSLFHCSWGVTAIILLCV